MERFDYVIVGGGVAGTTAAATIRNHDSTGRILLLTQEEHPLYSRISLHDYISSQTDQDRVLLKDLGFYQHQRIDFWPSTRASALDASNKQLVLSDGQEVGYSKLLIASGSRTKQWQVQGSHLDGVMTLRTLDDAIAIKQRMKTAKSVVVVGGGFISLEMIEALSQAGIATHAMIRSERYWSRFMDDEGSLLLHHLLAAQPMVQLHAGVEVASVAGEEKVEGIVTSDGKFLPADLVLTHIGVEADTHWLEGNGLMLDHGVEVDEFLQTSLPGIWAAGDVAFFNDVALGLRHRLGNWQNALIHGEAAGKNMAGKHVKVEAVSTYSLTVFNTHICLIGRLVADKSIVSLPRGSARLGSYGRILVQEGRIVGAILINRLSERHPLEQAIYEKTPITAEMVGDLVDETIPLRTTLRL